jgi:hypothetical protein
MSVKLGGYQTGMTYQWYRQMGHNPVSALLMLIPTEWVLCLFLIVLGLVLGGVL